MAQGLDALSKIKQLIDDSHSFVLSGGAGSGKTYALMEVIKYVHQKSPNAKIACITYTNVAVDQIKERAPFENIHSSTIHDFLWSFIKRYQLDIKKAFVELLGEEKIKYSGERTIDEEYLADKKIEYGEWESFEDGIISHDQVLLIAHKMFENSTKLSDILIDQYDYVLVDEYQDTSDEVLDILINHLTRAKKHNVVGLFGDRMQAIYKSDMSRSDEMIDTCEKITEVLLPDNRRSPKSVIGLINQLRTDQLTQSPAKDSEAPNWQKEGSIKFIYSKDESYDIESIKNSDFCRGWDFSNSLECKELYLVRKLIAKKAGFPLLMAIYADDQIVKYKNKIQKNIEENNVAIDEDDTFGQVIQKTQISPSRGQMAYFIETNSDLFDYAKSLPYKHFRHVYLYPDQIFVSSKRKQQGQSIASARKRDILIDHLLGIQECLRLYEAGQYNEFLRKTSFSITSIQSKRDLQKSMGNLKSMSEKNIIEVMCYAHEAGIYKKSQALEEFAESNTYIMKRLEPVGFSEITCLYNYIEDHTPYSTQHGVKGAEYDNVLVVLDNGGWSQYNFKNLFEANGSESVRKRTARLFYVCCSRVKDNLVVYYHQPSEVVLSTASRWFGESNVVPLTSTS